MLAPACGLFPLAGRLLALALTSLALRPGAFSPFERFLDLAFANHALTFGSGGPLLWLTRRVFADGPFGAIL